MGSKTLGVAGVVLAATLPLLSQPLLSQQTQPQCLMTNHLGTVDRDDAVHVLNRLTGGPSSTDIAAVMGNGTEFQSWVSTQLYPNLADENPELTVVLGQLQIPSPTGISTFRDLTEARFAYGMLTKWQLNEVMCNFWEEHFNTNLVKAGTYISNDLGLTGSALTSVQYWIEWQQHEMFRANALGSFETLITEVTLSPSMLIYLDMVDSDCPSNPNNSPNENYARELMELFTMGEFNRGNNDAANYTQSDIVQLARVLTGWRLQGGPDYVAAATGTHCVDQKRLFRGTGAGLVVPAGLSAPAELALVLDHIAGRDATRDFICRKLVTHFIGEEADEPGVHDALLNAMKSAWGPDGDIAGVLCTLIGSAEFQGAAYRWSRIRSPYERIVWGARMWDSTCTFGGVTSLAHLRVPTLDIGEMNYPMFFFPSPDGFPLGNLERLNSSARLEGVVAGSDIYRAAWAAVYLGIPEGVWAFSPVPNLYAIVLAEVDAADLDKPLVVAEALLEHAYPGLWTTTDRGLVSSALGTLDPSNVDDYLIDLSRGVAVAASFAYASLR